MTVYQLQPHPDHPPLETMGIDVWVGGGRDEPSLTYRVAGAERVVWPTPSSPARADQLWRTTCFEMFLRFDDGERYVEFNFSPSTRWAVYAFDGYREGGSPFDLPPPAIRRVVGGVDVVCDLGGLPHGDLAMGLSAVIEEEGGVLSYWALAHPLGAPDFHAPACFAAMLPSPRGA